MVLGVISSARLRGSKTMPESREYIRRPSVVTADHDCAVGENLIEYTLSSGLKFRDAMSPFCTPGRAIALSPPSKGFLVSIRAKFPNSVNLR